MRYLGLDIGKKAIGVSTGEVLARELATISAKKEESFYENGRQRAIEEIQKLIQSEQIDAIIAGLPVNEEGKPTEESKLISGFCTELENATNTSVHFVDETLTTFMAEDMLESQGLDRKEIATRVHQLAAQLILQQFLEENEAF